MAYRVEIAKNAEAELEELYIWVVARAPHQGAKWFNGLERAVLSLDRHPKRCPVAPESFNPDQPVRVLSYGRTLTSIASSSPSMTQLGSASCALEAERETTSYARRIEGRVAEFTDPFGHLMPVRAI